MMPTAQTLPRYSIEESYGNPSAAPFRYRARRFQHLQPLIDAVIAEKGHCRIADIGGTEYYWDIFGSYVADNPVEITLLNLDAQPVRSGKFISAKADATNLSEFADNSFDIVHSNSVIEHVGSWDRMSQMAHHVRRLAPVYFVQTPNFWFPYEPHFRCPFFHWLPEQARAELLMTFNLGFGGRRTEYDAAMRGVQSTYILGRRQFETLFPDAEIVRERALGLTKSLMAIRKSAI
jgi:Methyltransferase domain